MDKLRKSFEGLYKKFVNKSARFKNKIEFFDIEGLSTKHKLGHMLLERAEETVKQIKDIYEQDSIKIDQLDLQKKIQEFKSIYKNLLDLTKPETIQWLEALAIAIVVVLFLRNFVVGLNHINSGSAEPTLLVGDRILGNKMAYIFGKKPKVNDFIMFEDPKFEYDQYNKATYFFQKYVGIGLSFIGLSNGPDNIVKRIIAIPGETIEGRLENGKPVIYKNGIKLEESYINKYPLIAIEKKTGLIDLDSIGPVPIPKFLKTSSKYPLFYTYVPGVSFSNQPYYNMSSEEVGLKPGTLRPWMQEPHEPSVNEYGKVVDVFDPVVIPEGQYWVMGDSRQNSKDSRFWGLLDEKYITGKVVLILYSIDSEEPLWLFELVKSPIQFWKKSVRWNRILKTIS